jgi:hypothetical protein
MLKVAARFPETIDAHKSVLPLLQVREFSPEVSMGGAYFTPGHAAMTLADNWDPRRLDSLRNMAGYYVATRGRGRGQVRPALLGDDGTVVRYELAEEDVVNLSNGLARLATLLLAAGAEEVHPTVRGLPSIRSEREAIRWLDDRLPRKALSLTTVHAFSSCPIGERTDKWWRAAMLTATASSTRVRRVPSRACRFPARRFGRPSCPPGRTVSSTTSRCHPGRM